MSKIETIINKVKVKRQIKFNNKFRHLKNKQKVDHLFENQIDAQNSNNFINLTDIQVPNEFDCLFKFGPKFSPRNVSNVKDIIVGCEQIIKRVPNYIKPIIQGQLIEKILDNKTQKINKFDKLIKGFKDFTKINNLKICKADKMGDIVFISQQQYNQRVQNYIDETKCLPSKSSKIDILYRFFNKLSKNRLILCSLGNVSPPRNFSVPNMFIQIKTHKENNPARPVINCCNAPHVNFEKKLALFATPLIENSNFRIKSTYDFINRLPKKLENGDRLFTIDVVSLFPSVPLVEAHKLLISLMKHNFGINTSLVNLLNEANYHINNFNVFKINDKIYKQTQGLPMGSPLSPLYAEIYMQNIEKEFFVLNPLVKKPKFMVRYVDDIFIIWPYPQKELVELFDEITLKFPNIKFTIKEENNSQIQFLDVLVLHRDKYLDTTVFRKQLPRIIPFNSFNFNKYKFAAFNSYFYRAFKICSNKLLLNNELKVIEDIARDNGYNIKDIVKIKNRVHNKIYCKDNITLNQIKDKYKVIGKIKFNEYTYVIKNILNKFKLDVIVESNHNVFNRLRNDSDYKDKYNCSGVYKIPIVNQDKRVVSKYVGSTIRKISIRIKEHKRDYAKYLNSKKQNNGPTSLIQFLFENQNNNFFPDFDNIQAIPNSNQYTIRIQEALEILSSDTCNSDLPVKLSWAWQHLVSREIKSDEDGIDDVLLSEDDIYL